MKYEDIKDPDESSAYPSYFRSCENFEFKIGTSFGLPEIHAFVHGMI